MIHRTFSLSRLAPVLALSILAVTALASCAGTVEHAGHKTTTVILSRAQPSLKQESDFLLARAAIPGTLKTLEGFWIADPNDTLRAILTEGFCQYGIGFIEDDWEIDLIKKDFDKAAEDEAHMTKMFLRCMNYALMSLGPKWQNGLFGETDAVAKLVAGASSSQRTPLMWAAIGLGSMINHNKDNVELVAQAPTAKAMLLKVVEIDEKHPQRDPVLAALPHLALGLLYTAGGTQLGGDAKLATEHFMKALELTGDRFLLARVNYARKVGVMIQDRKLFHDELVKVLQTDPAIWPEQRLANEIAHRRARRYLSQEKELF